MPILVTIDDLEMLEFTIEHVSLVELLLEYSAKAPDRIFTFSHFLAEISARGRVLPNRRMEEEAKRIAADLDAAIAAEDDAG